MCPNTMANVPRRCRGEMAFREETLRRRQKEGFREENRWAGVTSGGEKSGDLGEGLGEVGSRAFGAREQVPRKLTREGVAPASHPPALAMKVTERLRNPPLGPGRCLSPARTHKHTVPHSCPALNSFQGVLKVSDGIG
ncbi:microsomal glutathione S-transferase 1 isoform X2 [Orcinus orca]|uniref:microsomal glutathione S-transferase 1 isoform X2 n=1 Tax=Orcinus orca TaxID=9733 RepID=UPI0014421233|nr:microsomal glutathione S-transferase 1 isoform X2 [Orcinus orca]